MWEEYLLSSCVGRNNLWLSEVDIEWVIIIYNIQVCQFLLQIPEPKNPPNLNLG